MYLFAYSGINESTAGFESHSPRALNKDFSSFASGGFTTGDRAFKLEEEEVEAQAEEFAASSIFLFLTLAEVSTVCSSEMLEQPNGIFVVCT